MLKFETLYEFAQSKFALLCMLLRFMTSTYSNLITYSLFLSLNLIWRIDGTGPHRLTSFRTIPQYNS